MKRIINFKNLLLGFLPMLCLFACDGNEHYDIVGNEGCVYIREVKGSREFPKRSEIFTVPERIFGTVELKFPVHSTMQVKEKVEVDLVIDNSLIDGYNKDHNTTYASIDPRFLIVENLKLTITEGQSVSDDSLSIVIPEEYYREIEAGEYMIPVRLEKVMGYLKATSIEENTAMYLIVSVLHSDSNVRPDNSPEGTSASKAEREGWTAEYSAPYKITDYSGQGITDINQALFDIDGQTCLEITQNFVEGDYLLVDLGKTYPNISSFFIQYSRGSYIHSKMNIYTSVDKINWIKQGSRDNTSTLMYCSFYAPLEARYVKIEGVSLEYAGLYLCIGDFNVYLK